ncbi:MAG: YqgE/AlgH family protein [Methylococcaceae bacterium]
MIEQIENLTNQFLVAMPGLNDPVFSKTVTYLCQHTNDGALGIMVNRPSEMTLTDILSQMNIEVGDRLAHSIPVYLGGPVHPERGFVLHEPTGQWDSTLVISPEVSLTTSRDILEALSVGDGPQRVLIALGYVGWSQGQLEAEIAENAWLNTPASTTVLFEQPSSQRWKAAAGLLGININLLTTQAGHS